MHKLICTLLALTLFVGSGAGVAGAKPKAKKAKPVPSINITSSSGTSLFGIPLNRRQQTISAGKNGVQVKRSQSDFFTRNSWSAGVDKNGGVRVKQHDSRMWPW